MKHVRFRDPAGAVRRGEWQQKGDEIQFGNERHSATEVDVLVPCKSSKIICVGRNYADHTAEMKSEVPDCPRFF